MTKSAKLRLCAGCRDNFYNGNNPLGVQECWSLKDAQPTRVVFVPVHSVPPWRERAETTLGCHHRQGYVRVNTNHPQLAKRSASK